MKKKKKRNKIELFEYENFHIHMKTNIKNGRDMQKKIWETDKRYKMVEGHTTAENINKNLSFKRSSLYFWRPLICLPADF